MTYIDGVGIIMDPPSSKLKIIHYLDIISIDNYFT